MALHDVKSPMKYSKGQVNRAGREWARFLDDWILMMDKATPDEEEVWRRHDPSVVVQAGEIIAWWRGLHAAPLARVNAGLRYYLRDCTGPITVTQRLKRQPTITDKLRREPSMNLSQMGDITAARARRARRGRRRARRHRNRHDAHRLRRPVVRRPRPGRRPRARRRLAATAGHALPLNRRLRRRRRTRAALIRRRGRREVPDELSSPPGGGSPPAAPEPVTAPAVAGSRRWQVASTPDGAARCQEPDEVLQGAGEPRWPRVGAVPRRLDLDDGQGHARRGRGLAAARPQRRGAGRRDHRLVARPARRTSRPRERRPALLPARLHRSDHGHPAAQAPADDHRQAPAGAFDELVADGRHRRRPRSPSPSRSAPGSASSQPSRRSSPPASRGTAPSAWPSSSCSSPPGSDSRSRPTAEPPPAPPPQDPCGADPSPRPARSTRRAVVAPRRRLTPCSTRARHRPRGGGLSSLAGSLDAGWRCTMSRAR